MLDEGTRAKVETRPMPALTRHLYFREARTTFALALPMTTGQLGQMLLGFSDSLMIGRVGVVPLAACGFANGVLGILFVTGLGLAAAVSILAAQAHGAHTPREAGETLRHGLAVSLGAGLALVALIYLASPFLWVFGAPPDVVAQARPFLFIVGWSLVPALAWQCLKGYCEALSRPALPTVAMLVAVLLNVFLSWVLIYGHLGAPALGLTGAAWATFATRVILLGGTFALVRRAEIFRESLPARWLAALSWTRLRRQLGVGLPVAAQLFLEVAVFSLAAIGMGRLGATPQAAHQVAITYAALTFMVPLGVSLAVSVRVGQAVGAGEWGRVRVIGLGGIGMATLFMTATASVFLLAGAPLARLAVADADTAALAARLLVVAGVFQIFDGAQVACMGALRGLADVRVPTVIAFVSYWLVALPVGYAFGIAGGGGAPGVWCGLALGLAVAAAGLGVRFLARTRPARTKNTNVRNVCQGILDKTV